MTQVINIRQNDEFANQYNLIKEQIEKKHKLKYSHGDILKILMNTYLVAEEKNEFNFIKNDIKSELKIIKKLLDVLTKFTEKTSGLDNTQLSEIMEVILEEIGSDAAYGKQLKVSKNRGNRKSEIHIGNKKPDVENLDENFDEEFKDFL